MTKFPKPIQLPQNVFLSRQERNVQLLQAARNGILIRGFLVLFELAGVYLFNSSALFLDALASSLDIVASLFLIICIKLAARPPDRDHPFGHGRYEPLAGLQLGLLLIVAGVGMTIQQTMQLKDNSEELFMDSRAWIIPAIATVFLEVCYQFTMRTAKKEHSPALAADAMHYRADALTSLLAATALIAAAFFPHWSIFIDHLGAIFIAFLMVGIGVVAFRQNLNQIMDRTPNMEWFSKVQNAALNVTGVKGTEKIRIQLYGPDAHVDIDIEVDPNLSVEKAHRISQKVRAEIQKIWPAVQDVTVHIEPYYLNDH
jgi:cation diffusion facilitator family transporter